MISLFKKLQQENLLKLNGSLLDLGCGNGKQAEPFFQFGYNTTLVDIDSETLSAAEKIFYNIKKMDLLQLIFLSNSLFLKINMMVSLFLIYCHF